jgi:hypothetical protein
MSIVIIDDYFREDDPDVAKKERDEVWEKVIQLNLPIRKEVKACVISEGRLFGGTYSDSRLLCLNSRHISKEVK